MTGEEWTKALTATPRLLDSDDAHEIEVARICLVLSIQRAIDKLDEIISGW